MRQSFKQERFFLSDHLQAGSLTDESATPVLSRIRDARFKRMVKPGDVVEISVSLGEKMGQFFSMTGEVRKEGKVALTISYALAMVREDSQKVSFLDLTDKKFLVVGVANRKSVAWSVAKLLQSEGAEVLFCVRSEKRKKELKTFYLANAIFLHVTSKSLMKSKT